MEKKNSSKQPRFISRIEVTWTNLNKGCFSKLLTSSKYLLSNNDILWMPVVAQSNFKGHWLQCQSSSWHTKRKGCNFFSSHFLFQIVVTRAESTFNEIEMTINITICKTHSCLLPNFWKWNPLILTVPKVIYRIYTMWSLILLRFAL